MTADNDVLRALEPCPFCSSTRLTAGGDDKYVGVHCENCGAQGPNHYATGCDWNRRALAAAPAPAVARVKPLEWRTPPECDTLQRVETAIGVYRYWTHHEAEGRWFWSLSGDNKRLAGEADTAEAAKAAAQADYEARILSALAPSEAPKAEPGGETPAFYALRSKTGMHIGLWKKLEHAVHASEEYPDGTIIPLYATPQPAPVADAGRVEEGWTGRKCPHCKGYGRRTMSDGEESPCPNCGGTGDEFAALARPTREAPDRVAEDTERLDWLEQAARESRTGISFDWVPPVEGEPPGFRFMRRFFIGEARKTLRSAIDAARAALTKEEGGAR